MLRNLGDMVPIIGSLFRGAGNAFDKAGKAMEKRGLAMQPVMQQKRKGAAFMADVTRISKGYETKYQEVGQTQKGWDAMGGKRGAWEGRKGAETQLLGSASGVGDIKNILELWGQLREEERKVKSIQKAIATKDPSFIPGHGPEAIQAMIDANTEMRAGLIKGIQPIEDYYNKLGELDPRYNSIATAVKNLQFGRAAKELDDLNRIINNHTQALKDMESAEEGRNKRLAEFAIKAEELVGGGL